MNKIRKGDEVIVLAGKNKGARGIVLSRKDKDHIVVEGVNVVKKHVRPNPMKGEAGGVVNKTMPIHQSSVAIYNPSTGKADRVGVKVDLAAEKGKRRVRIFRSSGEEIKVA